MIFIVRRRAALRLDETARSLFLQLEGTAGSRRALLDNELDLSGGYWFESSRRSKDRVRALAVRRSKIDSWFIPEIQLVCPPQRPGRRLDVQAQPGRLGAAKFLLGAAPDMALRERVSGGGRRVRREVALNLRPPWEGAHVRPCAGLNGTPAGLHKDFTALAADVADGVEPQRAQLARRLLAARERGCHTPDLACLVMPSEAGLRHRRLTRCWSKRSRVAKVRWQHAQCARSMPYQRCPQPAQVTGSQVGSSFATTSRVRRSPTKSA